ncbi:MAG: beta-galactosidase, partial [Clostridia bacterium]|nr:beta-galactosidase [Clostridia bacterium]
PEGLKKGDVIDVLVEAMGRINYGPNMLDRKGLVGQVMIGQQVLHHWEMTSIPLDNVADLEYNGLPQWGPSVLSATLTTDDPTDTFIDITNLKKGVVFVNGHNLGRYWNISTQQTLYIPGCWLKKGDNEIVAVDFDGADADELILTDEHRLECL